VARTASGRRTRGRRSSGWFPALARLEIARAPHGTGRPRPRSLPTRRTVAGVHSREERRGAGPGDGHARPAAGAGRLARRGDVAPTSLLLPTSLRRRCGSPAGPFPPSKELAAFSPCYYS
jgi:hypothetical protein